VKEPHPDGNEISFAQTTMTLSNHQGNIAPNLLVIMQSVLVKKASASCIDDIKQHENIERRKSSPTSRVSITIQSACESPSVVFDRIE
jgi:hypothetical protein